MTPNCKNVPNEPVLFNGKDIRTVYPISTFSGTTQDELVELIRQVQAKANISSGTSTWTQDKTWHRRFTAWRALPWYKRIFRRFK